MATTGLLLLLWSLFLLSSACEDTCTSSRALFPLENVMVISPKMLLPQDAEAGEIYWDNSDAWKEGDLSTEDYQSRISSFEVLDQIMLNMADRTLYPNLSKIVMAGHSAGGQVIQRYAMGAVVHDKVVAAGISIRYTPANPSSFVYLDSTRPNVSSFDGNCDTLSNQCDNATIETSRFTFAEPLETCNGTFNLYKYGLDQLNTYMSQLSFDNIVRDYPNRDVRYLQGTADTCNEMYSCGYTCDDHSLDKVCQALLQGLCRMQRGFAYYHHVQNFYSKRNVRLPVHQVVAVKGVEHDGCNLFKSLEALTAIFD